MKIITVELVGSHSGTLDARTVIIDNYEQEEMLIKAAVLDLTQACILNPGDSIRISEYQDD